MEQVLAHQRSITIGWVRALFTISSAAKQLAQQYGCAIQAALEKQPRCESLPYSLLASNEKLISTNSSFRKVNMNCVLHPRPISDFVNVDASV
jgi:hypothetical protein